MSEDSRVRIAIEKFLEYLAPSLAPVERHKWTGSDRDQFWDILRRGAIKRQQEALGAALNMVDAGVGHFAVTLVRQAYEELIWIEYLHKHPELSNELSIDSPEPPLPMRPSRQRRWRIVPLSDWLFVGCAVSAPTPAVSNASACSEGIRSLTARQARYPGRVGASQASVALTSRRSALAPKMAGIGTSNATAPATAPKTWRPCAASPSASCAPTSQRSQRAASNPDEKPQALETHTSGEPADTFGPTASIAN
jgi:hypothetical protein